MTCPFCHPDPDLIFHQSELIVALWDRYPVSPGHALLTPRRHVAEWFDATPAEQLALIAALPIAKEAIQARHKPDDYNIGINNGQAAGKLGRLRNTEKQWQRLVSRVAAIVIKMPLWKLQTVAGTANEFLYRRDEYNNRHIRLLPGVSLAFRTFHALLTSMIRGGWIAHIHRIKGNHDMIGPGAELESFLFGIDRRSLNGYRQLLRSHQAGECFYCGKPVTGQGDLDHFIPWSRYAIDLGHNFVYAHKSCNNAKSDYLAAADHIERWRIQNLDEAQPLARQFDQAGLAHDLERSHLIARWAYEQGHASHTRLWLKGREFEPCDYRWQTALGVPGGLRLAAAPRPHYE